MNHFIFIEIFTLELVYTQPITIQPDLMLYLFFNFWLYDENYLTLETAMKVLEETVFESKGYKESTSDYIGGVCFETNKVKANYLKENLPELSTVQDALYFFVLTCIFF